MEPNKLEKQFREQLNSREIKPSEMAWAKLDTMLSATEKPKAKFPWLYVAASFTALLLIGTAYFIVQEKAIENQKNGVVIQSPVAPKAKLKPLDSDYLKIEKKESVVQVVQKSVSKSNQSSELKQESRVVKNQVAEVSSLNQYDTIVISSEEKNFKSISKNKYVSAEKLLAEISNTKFESADETMRNTTKVISVNPNILLSNVETELNQSFKESALDRLNKNFKTIRTVLVNRNYKDE